MNRVGQSIAEFNLATALVLTPLIAGGAGWGLKEYRRFECAYHSFIEARAQLIRTHSKSRFDLECGSGIRESVTLEPLESLDRNKGGLSLEDLEQEASRLWGDFSFLLPSLQESGSGFPSGMSEPSANDKSISIDVPEPPF